MSRHDATVANPRLVRAAGQARAVQLLYVGLVPVACFVAVAVTHASSYEDGWWPTVVVPALLVGGPAAGLFLSWSFHRRWTASGVADRAVFLPSLPTWLAGASLFLVEAVLGAVVLLAAAFASGDSRRDLSAAGTATVSLSLIAALLWLLGGFVVGQAGAGQLLAAQSAGLDPPITGRWLRALGFAPSAVMCMAIVTAFAVAWHNVALLVVGVVILSGCLAGTVFLGLLAGYRPPGEGQPRVRRRYYLECVVGLIGEVAYIYSLWQRPR